MNSNTVCLTRRKRQSNEPTAPKTQFYAQTQEHFSKDVSIIAIDLKLQHHECSQFIVPSLPNASALLVQRSGRSAHSQKERNVMLFLERHVVGVLFSAVLVSCFFFNHSFCLCKGCKLHYRALHKPSFPFGAYPLRLQECVSFSDSVVSLSNHVILL